ncbi:MAG: 50S ribosomal protein L23, partial [Terrimicrobium sp.]
MRGPQEIIRAPLISEKGSLLAESTQQVLFKVQPDANKIEVKKAVETLFKVKVVKV